MDAAALTCPQCGAAASADAVQCSFCHARLATTACPSCYGLVFVGSKHCAHCGAAITAVDERAGTRACPRGCGTLRRISLGGVELEECAACSGVWLKPEVFQKLCAEEERRSVFLGAELQARHTPAAAVTTVRYVPCPDCGKPMNRVNFGKRSGVIVDACAQHGTWFDADELRRVVEFVRDGGLERARVQERRQLEEERRLLEARKNIASWGAPQPPQPSDASPEATGAVAGVLLRLFGTF
jgi:Zn-finger nucleic acid-binding protein